MKKRVFIALQIPNQVIPAIQDHENGLRSASGNLKVRWVKMDNLHVTMRFFGEIDDRNLSQITDAVKESVAGINAFDVSLEECGVFPQKRNPKVLWIRINDPEKKLRKIVKNFEENLCVLGFSKEKREFSPHLTIARLRSTRGAEHLVAEHLAKKFEPVNFEVSEIVIYESKLQPTGSVYSRLATVSI